MTQQPDERSPYAIAMEWSSRIMTISLELVAPPLLGYWLDQRYGTRFLWLIVGAILGFITATMSLMRLVKAKPGDRPSNRSHWQR